ncbi:MAG: aryl-sulfate sulfotransferase [Planctomycetota bacterium]|nr:aryl-sulfate sulfotransferase [Planctomycetota bacterium]
MARIVSVFCVLLWVLSGVHAQKADAVPPADFPVITDRVYDANALGDGYVYLAVAGEVEGVGSYLMILDNEGALVWYKELVDCYAFDFKMQPNGLLTYAQLLEHHASPDGGNALHMVMDRDFSPIDSFQMADGYTAEARDFQWLPNGHALLFGCCLTEVASGGNSSVLIADGVIQELDADRNVVFQWRMGDHCDFHGGVWDAQDTDPVVDKSPLNSIGMDMDGHILIATPDWVGKISRHTGQILWHLGGEENEFAFVGVESEEAVGHFGGQAFHRLDNGNVLIYDNGDRSGIRSSRVHEYRLDEANKIAEHVWSYIPDPPIFGWYGGNAQRLANGNTFIGWGGGDGNHSPVCTEVTPDGRKVFELSFDDSAVESYRAYRFPLPADISGIGVTKQYVGVGDNEFRRGGIDTGVTVRVNSFTGTGYNVMGVVRTPLAPLYPTFEGCAPVVVPVRLQIGANGIITIDARIVLDTASFGLRAPETLTIYHRDSQKSGPFRALATSYDPVGGKLCADITEFGELTIGRPDSENVP